MYNTLTSQRNPQIRIKRGLEIRYRKVMSPLLVLLHTVHPLLSLSHFLSLFVTVFLFLEIWWHAHRPKLKGQNTDMQITGWPEIYLKAIMFPVS